MAPASLAHRRSSWIGLSSGLTGEQVYVAVLWYMYGMVKWTPQNCFPLGLLIFSMFLSAIAEIQLLSKLVRAPYSDVHCFKLGAF